MPLQRGTYFSALSKGGMLDMKAVNHLVQELGTDLRLEPVPPELLQRTKSQAKITEELTRLPIYVARGKRSWGGLVVGFPGSKSELTTEIVSTPYLRRILYPILDLHHRISSHYNERLPCIYILGASFPEVFIKKFLLLESVTPHVILLTSDLANKAEAIKSEENAAKLPEFPGSINEAWVQTWLCRKMMEQNGLQIPVKDGDIVTLGYLGREIPTGEGTTQRERLDILGVDKEDHSLVAFEIKGPACSRVELENLFLQGLEHQKWLERNKMAVKLLFDKPDGRRINTTKRVRLILGFFNEAVPDLFWELRLRAMKRDRHLKIDFVRFTQKGALNINLLLTEHIAK